MKVSPMDFYAFQLMNKERKTNHILKGRQLSHQYFVDIHEKN
jgi:hypothetical protein